MKNLETDHSKRTVKIVQNTCSRLYSLQSCMDFDHSDTMSFKCMFCWPALFISLCVCVCVPHVYAHHWVSVAASRLELSETSGCIPETCCCSLRHTHFSPPHCCILPDHLTHTQTHKEVMFSTEIEQCISGAYTNERL